jgi:hypothetical protein
MGRRSRDFFETAPFELKSQQHTNRGAAADEESRKDRSSAWTRRDHDTPRAKP